MNRTARLRSVHVSQLIRAYGGGLNVEIESPSRLADSYSYLLIARITGTDGTRRGFYSVLDLNDLQLFRTSSLAQSTKQETGGN